MAGMPGCERNKVQNLITTLHTVSGVILTIRINYFHLISCRQTSLPPLLSISGPVDLVVPGNNHSEPPQPPAPPAGLT